MFDIVTNTAHCMTYNVSCHFLGFREFYAKKLGMSTFRRLSYKSYLSDSHVSIPSETKRYRRNNGQPGETQLGDLQADLCHDEENWMYENDDECLLSVLFKFCIHTYGT